ncbi:MAG: protease modulator HflC, partial [Candidatus Glassbacteria bacterium]|nr:protease modulator HflC [Candidatus Glassbacteria bacterium]
MSRSLSVILVVLILLLIVLGNSVYRVFETEQVQITKFGAPVRTVTEPGLHFKLPFVNKLHVFEKRLLDYDSAPTEVLTQDKKTLIVDNYAKWKVIDPLKFMMTVQNEAGAQSRLDDIIYSEVRTEMGKHMFHEIISEQRSVIMETVTHSS